MFTAANSLIGFIFALTLTILIIPIVNKLSLGLNIIDKPEKRKQHKKRIVRLGGLGILIGLYSTMILLIAFNFINFDENSFFWPVFYMAPLFFILGFLDDLFNLSPFLRLFFQIFLSTIFWASGFHINNIEIQSFYGGNSSFYLINSFSLLFTVFWIVGMINAINWIDGLDGLAIGILCISTLGMICAALGHENIEYLPILTALFGVCLAFLFYNYYPAKIVMGDGGSYLLGFFAASLSILMFEPGLNSSFKSYLDFYFLESLLFFAVPIFDMVYVIFLRLNQGKSIFFPDRKHIHHRLFDGGFSHRDSVTLIFALSQWFVSFSLLASFNKFNKYTLVIAISSTALLALILFLKCNLSKLLILKLSPKINKFDLS
ncbi:undecaprenyl/decaprenyl-phosphate alpha-N-acetylglucosaminyl 1-phosphate transferase [Prochlorococcus sp. AH-716-P20]|nr:undecaprenyl/decaprenyl-phosphate alpha-N-acetylglucosaminyl 1-phosphate transferase [Prochlorococcus sp. AH-716-P20]